MTKAGVYLRARFIETFIEGITSTRETVNRKFWPPCRWLKLSHNTACLPCHGLDLLCYPEFYRPSSSDKTVTLECFEDAVVVHVVVTAPLKAVGTEHRASRGSVAK